MIGHTHRHDSLQARVTLKGTLKKYTQETWRKAPARLNERNNGRQHELVGLLRIEEAGGELRETASCCKLAPGLLTSVTLYLYH